MTTMQSFKTTDGVPAQANSHAGTAAKPGNCFGGVKRFKYELRKSGRARYSRSIAPPVSLQLHLMERGKDTKRFHSFGTDGSLIFFLISNPIHDFSVKGAGFFRFLLNAQRENNFLFL
jgi:hypothetical protein